MQPGFVNAGLAFGAEKTFPFPGALTRQVTLGIILARSPWEAADDRVDQRDLHRRPSEAQNKDR
jgi:hypothetical protein